MIQAIATNFGVSPSDISFKDFQSSGLIVLNGSFSIDATDADYLAAGVLRVTLPTLSITKSHETAVYVLNTKDGAHDITITKTWIENGNTLCIMPALEYEPLGGYTFLFMSAFVPVNVAGEVSFANHHSCTPSISRGTLTSVNMQYVEDNDWLMLAMSAQSLSFDETEEDVVATLPDFPDMTLDFLPVIYTGTVSDTYGSKFYPASLQNGVLTIKKDGIAGDSGATFYKFIKAFIVK